MKQEKQTQDPSVKTNNDGGYEFKPSKIKKVVKRDSRVVDFDSSKIQRAINAALMSVEVEDASKHSYTIAIDVIAELEKIYADQTPNIEDVQDFVERGISQAGFFEASKAYILYRSEHSRLRDQTDQDTQNMRIKVKMKDGSTKAMDFNDIESKLRQHFGDSTYKSTMYEILDELRLTLFDGMTEQEVDKSIIMSLVARIERHKSFSHMAAKALLDSIYRDILDAEMYEEDFDNSYRKNFRKMIVQGVEEGRLNPKMLKFGFKELTKAMVPERDFILRYKGLQMLFDKYVLKSRDQEIMEVPQYFWMRVAMGLALNEKDKEDKAIEFYNVISQLHYVPSSPTLYHAGLVHSQMSSCFLMTVHDDLDHIFKSYGDQAQLAKYAGGIGLDWTDIRATGALIKSTNVPSQGVIPFLKICDSTNASINRSGRKRGAAVVYLEPWHFDVESFLELRRNVGDERRRTHNINTAMWIPDLFMKRVAEDGRWTLFSPDETPELHDLYGAEFEKKYVEYEAEAEAGNMTLVKTMKATDLWKKMITMLFETGHPWINFKDPCNVRSPQDHVGVVHSSNLCTEITLNTSKDEVAVCNLGSINLAAHTDDNGEINRDMMAASIKVAMRMLDNVIDLNFYPIKETENSNMKHRPVGLGIMGFQDVLSKSGVSFDSEVAVKLSDEIQEFVAYNAYLASSELAEERGAYSSYKGSKWDRGELPQDTFVKMEKIRGIPTYIAPEGKLDWKPVRESIKKHGMRNSNCLAIAPTASISNLAGCYPSIEAPYSNLYVKSNMFGEFIVSNDYLVEDLQKIGIWGSSMIEKLKANDGNIQGISEIPVHIRSKYKGAFSIDPHWTIRHAAHRSKWIDQSQSINIFTNTTKGSVLADIYMDAWKSGLKTTYYLRSLGASAIEKSTVSLESQGATGSYDLAAVETDTYVSEPASVPASVSAPVSVASASYSSSTTYSSGPSANTSVAETAYVSSSVSSEAVSTPSVDIVEDVQVYEMKACRLDDPTCESCQ